MTIHQLVFGYDDGHRLLGGSCDLGASTLSRLLGATDAAPGSIRDRLVTGMPLPAEDLYALCFTWSAPDVQRPGAVWSHVLLIGYEELAAKDAPILLAGLARRPSAGSLETYNDPLRQSPSPRQSALQVNMGVLSRVLAVTGHEGGRGATTVKDLAEAERALLAIWQAQWPALRMSFSFATRDAVRATAVRGGIVAVRRLQGPQRLDAARPAPWADSAARDLLATGSRLRPFLSSFGPDEEPSIRSMAALAEIWDAVQSGNVDATRAIVETTHPIATQGTRLKCELFGKSSKLWRASEIDKLSGLLRATSDAWDPESLKLVSRFEAFLQKGGSPLIAEALQARPAGTAFQPLVDALTQRSDPRDLAAFVPSSPDILLEAVTRSDALAGRPETWTLLPAEVAIDVLHRRPLASSTLIAAISGGRAAQVVDAIGMAETLKTLAEDPSSLDPARTLLSSERWTRDLWTSVDSPAVVLLFAAVGYSPPAEVVVPALEARRGKPDEIWLRAAVSALVSPDTDASALLSAAFGPLHHAITSDRLPRELWAELDPVLPAGGDPAQRLRRHLLVVGRAAGWSGDEMAAALRDAGPFATEVLRDFEHKDGWYDKVLKMWAPW